MNEQVLTGIAGICAAAQAHKGNVILAASIETDQKHYMRKGGTKGNPINPYYGDVIKVQEVSLSVGFIYQNAVNKSRVADGLDKITPEEFEPGWGTLSPDRKVVTLVKDGVEKLYLYGRMSDARNQRYYRASTGEEIPYAELKPHFYPRTPNTKAEDVECRKITLTNIASVRLDHVEYVNTEFKGKINREIAAIAPEAETVNTASETASETALPVTP